MTAPAITVVVPVFDGENYLAATLRSALDQTYPIAELIVIDDGSSDSTAAIAESFGAAVHLHRTANQGVSAARNLGISLAKTEWVALLDHDDIWEPNHLECLAAAIQRRPDADAVYGRVRRYVMERRMDSAQGQFVLADALPFPDETKVARLLMERCPILTSAMALRRSRILALGGFDSYFSNAQDWDMWVRLAKAKAVFVGSPEITTLYRVHCESRTHNALRALGYYLDVLERDILPALPAWKRLPHQLRVSSRLESEAAIMMRELKQPGALRMMLRSVARWPIEESRRYMILASMLLRVRSRRNQFRSNRRTA
ncbi:Glycosyl transferase family 2 [Bryocella elongata]|uniref:Glycosyl transferase family 2 n=1 Tax=Bryocella elongata TaxID=863522 RepID=A0A1H6A811_9BACT|nr:glycosyltransferase family 2 protein [Bryocella elongata]SEG44187.1 Glycosyl transferase family 2 [Bryocella elongata]